MILAHPQSGSREEVRERSTQAESLCLQRTFWWLISTHTKISVVSKAKISSQGSDSVLNSEDKDLGVLLESNHKDQQVRNQAFQILLNAVTHLKAYSQDKALE